MSPPDSRNMDEGVQILELARNAQKLFEQQEPREKRRLLNLALSNCTWDGGEVVATFRQPPDLLAETTAGAVLPSAGKKGNSTRNDICLPLADTYRTMLRAPDPTFRRLLEGIRQSAASGQVTSRRVWHAPIDSTDV
jgi:hypothetical protein